jgi:hypothetical protein
MYRGYGRHKNLPAVNQDQHIEQPRPPGQLGIGAKNEAGGRFGVSESRQIMGQMAGPGLAELATNTPQHEGTESIIADVPLDRGGGRSSRFSSEMT